MAETVTIKLESTNQHTALFLGTRTDALTGEEWEFFECPICGYLYKMQWKPLRTQTLRFGEDMITPEEAEGFDALCRTPAGRMQVSKRLSEAPGHSYVRVPDEDGLREIARLQGRLEEFEAGVEQAIIDGKPLFRFGMGGATAETWPKGTGPNK